MGPQFICKVKRVKRSTELKNVKLKLNDRSTLVRSRARNPAISVSGIDSVNDK
jgi:hypothetical protein